MPIETEAELAISNQGPTAPQTTNAGAGRITLKARTALEANHVRTELDPLRRILAALADSLAATYRREAAEGGVFLSDVEIRVEAGLDLDVLSATNTAANAGPGHLRVEVRLGSTADINTLEILRQSAERCDPVLALLRHATPTRLEIALDLRDTRSIAA